MIKVYQVGGSVRDSLLGRPHHDIDFAIEAPSYTAMHQYVEQQLGCTIIYEKPEFATLKAKHPDYVKVVDFSMCRHDGFYSNNRHPDSIDPASILEDLARRDFSMNAIAVKEDGSLVDPYHGVLDIKNKILRCVGSTKERLSEDPLRALRALRFSVTHGFLIHDEILTTLLDKEFATIFTKSHISADRISTELNKMFSTNSAHSIELLGKINHDLLTHLFKVTRIKVAPTL